MEAVYGYLSHSTALLADAGHNLSDVLGLALAWAAVVWSRKAPSQRFTYGLRSSSTLVSLANAAFLLLTCGAIGWEAVQRLFAPPEVNTLTVMIVAAMGIAINGASALLLMRGSHSDLNMRGAYLHMVADAAVSLGVVVSAFLIRLTGWNWLDAASSLALNAVPDHIDIAAIDRYLRTLPGVSDVHDLHVWGLSTSEVALTAHLVMPAGYPGDTILDTVRHRLHAEFRIHHATLQCEQGTTLHQCSLHAGVH